jgi:hypothetical protein
MLPILALAAVGVRVAVYVKETYVDAKDKAAAEAALKSRFPDYEKRNAVSLTAYLTREQMEGTPCLIDKEGTKLERLNGLALTGAERGAANRLRNRG